MMSVAQAAKEIETYLDYYHQSPDANPQTTKALETAVEVLRAWDMCVGPAVEVGMIPDSLYTAWETLEGPPHGA
jgi:hypothetical protein